MRLEGRTIVVLLAASLSASGCSVPAGGKAVPTAIELKAADVGATADDDCGPWQVGTMTGYNNSDSGDDPNAGSVAEFSDLTDEFYDNVPIASIDSSDFPHDKYRFVDIKFNGTIGRVETWDECRNEDCPDGTDCCTQNKHEFAQPGYLLDLETRTAARLFGLNDAEDSLNTKIEYRICSSFDPDPIAQQFGAHR
jgi:hypothetical protein